MIDPALLLPEPPLYFDGKRYGDTLIYGLLAGEFPVAPSR
jgi:hypothetical protein